MPSQNPSTPSHASQASQGFVEVMINGMKVKQLTTPRAVTSGSSALFTKVKRESLSEDQRSEFFEKCVKPLPVKFNLLDLKIDDPDKLSETYDLEMAISRTRAHHLKYDMHDVFTIVKPDADPDNFECVNLYTDYAAVTVMDVATSNAWYATYTADPDNKWFNQNLKLTYEHLANSSEEGLATKINETYFSYNIESRGGPLYFKLMMDMLQNNSDAAAEHLVKTVQNLKITQFEGENVEKVVSLIRGAVKRLQNLRTKSGKSALPADLNEMLIKVFQTSSVAAFNTLFNHIAVQEEYHHMRSQASSVGAAVTNTLPSVSEILAMAEDKYRQLCSIGQWTGVTTKANATVFHTSSSSSGKGGSTCFNCGGNHSLKDCPKTINPDQVKANKKAFWDKKKSKSGSSNQTTPKHGTNPNSNTNPTTPKSGDGASKGQWAPPTEDEKNNNKGRRLIKGQLHYWHYKSKRWRLCQDQPQPQPTGNLAGAPAPGPAPAPPGTTPVAHTTSTQPTQGRDLALANAEQQVVAVFRNLLGQFN